MKWIITIPAILLFALAGCGKDKQSTDELIIVDVTKNYPEKELILQDFMDVEYIPLETNDEFVTQGKVIAIGAEVILITNWANDGNLFVFDRKASALELHELNTTNTVNNMIPNNFFIVLSYMSLSINFFSPQI